MPGYGVSFYRSAVSDNEHLQTVEDAFRFYFGMAGIHDYRFQSRLGPTTKTITSTSGWSIDWQTAEMPFEVLVTADVSSTPFAFVVGTPDHGMYYLVGINDAGQAFVQKNGATIYREAQFIPAPIIGPVQFSFREIAWRENEGDKWAVFSLFSGGRHFLSCSVPLSEFMRTVRPCSYYHVGIAAYAGYPVTFTNLRVPQLTNYIEWNSIDPGEYLMGGLQRALEGRYIRFFLRYNGSVAAYRPYSRAPIADLGRADIYALQTSIDRRRLVSHARMLGAYTEAEYLDKTAAQHRFVEINNPMLFSIPESASEAAESVLRQREEAVTAIIEMPYKPLWEIDDVISYEGTEYVIMGIEYKLQMTSGMMVVKLKQYLGAT